jgi:hypothetical protein
VEHSRRPPLDPPSSSSMGVGPRPRSAPSGRDTNHSDKNRLAACASPAAATAPVAPAEGLEERGRRGRELPGVVLDEEAAPVEQRATQPVAVL